MKLIRYQTKVLVLDTQPFTIPGEPPPVPCRQALHHLLRGILPWGGHQLGWVS